MATSCRRPAAESQNQRPVIQVNVFASVGSRQTARRFWRTPDFPHDPHLHLVLPLALVLVLVLVLGVTTAMQNLRFASEAIISLPVPIELRSNPPQQPRTQRTVDRQLPVQSREISPESHLHQNNPPRITSYCPDAHAVAQPPSRSCRQRSERHHPESVATRGRSGCYECHSLRGARPSALRYPSGSLPNRCPLITARVFPKVSDAMVRGPVGTAGNNDQESLW